MSDDETRDEIEIIVNEEPVHEAVQEEIEPVKAKPKEMQKQSLKSK